MIQGCKRINLICGHYGSGKTNLAVNLALALSGGEKPVALADLDTVNPYFRSADFSGLMQARGIRTVNPLFANSNLDLPALTGEIDGILSQKGLVSVLDVGGDSAGATVIGRYAGQIRETGDFACFCVINQYRNLTADPEEAAENLREIEQAMKLPITGLVNNSNLSTLTTAETVSSSKTFAEQVSRLTGIPIAASSYDRQLSQQGLDGLPNSWPIEIFVKRPWES